MTKINPKEIEVQLYKSVDGSIKMEVKLKKDTVWLNQAQIAELFGTKRPAITKHLGNIFRLHELNRKRVCSKMEHTAKDGKSYLVEYYNLDAIISVGYRVNSQKATQFRIWATKVLRSHLLQGYTVNEKALIEQKSKIKELQNAIDFIENKSHQTLLKDQSVELLSIIKQYTKSLDLLQQYDKKNVKSRKGKTPSHILNIVEIKQTIESIRSSLAETKKDLGFFGIEPSDKVSGIIGNLQQTFDGLELYKTIEDKAANLLYMIIKDHPFIDGNKRIGSLLFIQYLDQNNALYRETGERKINDNALVVLALLVAISNPKEKSVLTKVIINLIS